MKKIAAGHGPDPVSGVNTAVRHSPSSVEMLTSSRAIETSPIGAQNPDSRAMLNRAIMTRNIAERVRVTVMLVRTARHRHASAFRRIYSGAHWSTGLVVRRNGRPMAGPCSASRPFVAFDRIQDGLRGGDPRGARC